MTLIRYGARATDDYTLVLDDGPIPEDAPVLVDALRFLADAAELARRDASLGVVWPNDRRVAELAPYLDRLSLIALRFPTFRDGRAYSQARQLREHYGYRRELRATGEVLRDQLLFMLRAGFDSFVLKKDADADVFASVLGRYSVFYQPSADSRVTAAAARIRGIRSGVSLRENQHRLDRCAGDFATPLSGLNRG
jgi:uncharacterized protein (DUF934 family)